MSTQTRNGSITGNGTRKLNQFGDYEDVTNMTVEDWDYRWSLQQTKFHMPRVHPMLQKHIDKLTNGKIQQRIFVPLCGKSMDLKWLLDQGHKVVGNECASEGCKLFFEENNIPYKIEPLPGIQGDVYKATDGKAIEIDRCDCFDLNSSIIGKFDCIWDRGGFVALPVTERQRYANMIQSLMKVDCRYILDCFLVDNGSFAGPPFHCEEEDVSRCFDDFCSIKKIDVKDAFTKWQESWGITSFVEEVYQLVPK